MQRELGQIFIIIVELKENETFLTEFTRSFSYFMVFKQFSISSAIRILS